jgi:HPt (histidine-containing phosphotransfer) domain-containing protein
MTDPVLDPRLGVESTYGDPVTWREALELLYGLLPEYADNLSAAMEAGDTAGLHRVAHGLAGASSYCGTVAVHVSAKRLEALCLQENAGALHEAVNAVLHNIGRLIHLRQSGCLPLPDGAPIY